MSSAALPSDEVAEDYKSSLEDLVTNDRNQISVLTVIAKENTEHAMAISRVLENHIRSAPPSRKLPALYVLDSLVKNVGTPYTLYLGHNLYDTFMNAYVLVDSPIRKKLDEMLKTWKEPIPGSLDTRPVFPLEKSRQIENALIKARTNALARSQSQPQPRAVQTPPQQFRNGPVQLPAQHRPPHTYQAQPSNGNGAYYDGSSQNLGFQNPIHTQQPPQFHSSQKPFHTASPTPPPTFDLYRLQRDLNRKVQDHQHYVDTHPWNTEVKSKLQMLKDLENHIATRSLGTAQLLEVQKVVSNLAPLPQDPQPPASEPVYVPPQVHPSNTSYGIPQQTPAPIASLPISSNLAELIRQSASRTQPTPPPNPSLPVSHSTINTPPVDRSTPALATTAPIPVLPPVTAENPLLAQLRASGILPATGTPPSLASSTQTPPVTQLHHTPATTIKLDVQLTSASVKIPRPHLIRALFDGRPNRCNTCGRRFTTDQSGKERKARHLDWHFKTNTRLAEALKRGQNRSWYVDERDWIASREFEDDSGPIEGSVAPANGTLSPHSTLIKAAKSQEQYVLVPSDAESRNQPCPICQEKFEATWSEERQEFIWRDARRIGAKIYHASCYQEATKDRERGNATPNLGHQQQQGRSSQTATPDSVLGKRKKEEEFGEEGARVKIKIEGQRSD